MKIIAGTMLAAAFMMFSAASGARTPSSSFVPRGPEPHSSLSDKQHAHRGSHLGSKSISGKVPHHRAAKTSMHHSAKPN